MARLPRKVREINDFNATDWFEKLLQRTTKKETRPLSGAGLFVREGFALPLNAAQCVQMCQWARPLSPGKGTLGARLGDNSWVGCLPA